MNPSQHMLEKAMKSAEKRGGKILQSIVDRLNNELGREWEMRNDEVTFARGSDEISLDLGTGFLTPKTHLTDLGQKAMEILVEEVKAKKKKWLRIAREFEEIRIRLKTKHIWRH